MATQNWRTALLERHRWALYLVPFFTYMLVGALEPAHGDCATCFASSYTWLYTLKIVLTAAAVAFVWPGYRDFKPHLSILAIAVGVVGGPLWIGVCGLDWEHAYLLPVLKQVGLGGMIGAGDRPAFNPFDPNYQLSHTMASAFLVVRFFGLVIVVPLIEEFFLRGFVMRFFMDGQWWKVPFGKADRLALFLGTAVPMLMHPGELLAAFLWFSMITWLMLRTRNIWDCVVAHALTNLILGIYVLTTGTWRLM